MIDHETTIRQAVLDRVDPAPMPPSIESIDALEARNLPSVHHRARRGVLVATGVIALGALLAVVVVTTRGRDQSAVSVGAPEVSSGAVPLPLAGRTLPGRYGLPAGVPGYQFVVEADRPAGLRPGELVWLPTGPLGPLYAQELRANDDPARSGANLMKGFAVLTLLPEDQASVIASATGGGAEHPVTVGSHPATAAEPWSPSDGRAVAWQQDGASIVVIASPDVTEAQLLSVASQVGPVTGIPLLHPLALNPNGSGPVDGFYSLAPGAYQPPDPTRPGIVANPWQNLTSERPLNAALGTLVAHLSDAGDRITLREIGQPDAHTLALALIAFRPDSGEPVWATDSVSYSNGSSPDLSNRYLVTGTTPTDATSVRMRLDDGTTVEASSYDEGRGWPWRVWSIPVPDARTVVHLEARSSDGTLVYSGPIRLARPDASTGAQVITDGVGRCGGTDPSTPTDC